MNGAEILDLGRDAIWVTVLVAAGPMIVGLVVGLVVSLLQTLTPQIQGRPWCSCPRSSPSSSPSCCSCRSWAGCSAASPPIFSNASRRSEMSLTLYGVEIWAVALLFARMGAMLMLLPAFGEPAIPARIRLAFALALAIALAPTLADRVPVAAASAFGMAGQIIGEIVIGVMLGGAARILVSALATAGRSSASRSASPSRKRPILRKCRKGNCFRCFSASSALRSFSPPGSITCSCAASSALTISSALARPCRSRMARKWRRRRWPLRFASAFRSPCR